MRRCRRRVRRATSPRASPPPEVRPPPLPGPFGAERTRRQLRRALWRSGPRRVQRATEGPLAGLRQRIARLDPLEINASGRPGMVSGALFQRLRRRNLQLSPARVGFRGKRGRNGNEAKAKRPGKSAPTFLNITGLARPQEKVLFLFLRRSPARQPISSRLPLAKRLAEALALQRAGIRPAKLIRRAQENGRARRAPRAPDSGAGFLSQP